MAIAYIDSYRNTDSQILPQDQSTYLGDPESVSTFRLYFINFSKTIFYEGNFVSQCSHSAVLQVNFGLIWGISRFQLMQILALFGVYFDSEVVFVTKFSLLFRFTLAIL